MANSSAQTDSIFEQEMSTFLQLANGEIRLSMKDASGSVQMLTRTFMEMVRDVHEIKALAEEMHRNPDAKNLEKINTICDEYFNKVQESTVGFQFYDKLTQRLTHTTESIRQLQDMMQEPEQLKDTSTWKAFKEEVHRRYNTEADRRFFEAMMEGNSIKEAIRIATEGNGKTKGTDSVELF
ncbi:MAG: hypothetical protein OEZ43_03570 [Gammaproteobacteria bacterium]|nr:hypothetical protein [Gammaproteobacteria bacterium]